MPKRQITLEITTDSVHALSDDEYADLAHAIWSVAQAALPSHDFQVLHDQTAAAARALNTKLNKRWQEHGENRRWEGKGRPVSS